MLAVKNKKNPHPLQSAGSIKYRFNICKFDSLYHNFSPLSRDFFFRQTKRSALDKTGADLFLMTLLYEKKVESMEFFSCIHYTTFQDKLQEKPFDKGKHLPSTPYRIQHLMVFFASIFTKEHGRSFLRPCFFVD